MAYPLGHVETFVLTVGTAPVNVVTGTTSAPTTTDQIRQHKGIGIVFQNQHATAKVKVGGADVGTNGGIQLALNFAPPYSVFPGGGSTTSINAAEWWIVSDTGSSTVVVQVIHSI
jgi:hypothetical protein